MKHLDYLHLRAEVDDVAQAATGRRRRDLACDRGCTMCCHVQLTVSSVEAHAIRQTLRTRQPHVRDELRARAKALHRREKGPGGLTPCVMLDDDGACAIYEGRPLVCRTQGHALLYPKGDLPGDAVFAESKQGDITWCALNYTAHKPQSEDVLDAERINQRLALANLKFLGGDKAKAQERISLRDLALE